MIVSWDTVFITFKRVRMHNSYPIYNMDMIEKSHAPEKSEKENQKEVLRNIKAKPFQINQPISNS